LNESTVSEKRISKRGRASERGDAEKKKELFPRWGREKTEEERNERKEIPAHKNRKFSTGFKFEREKG